MFLSHTGADAKKMWTLIVKTRNQIDFHIICWEENSYEVLDQESKLVQVKTSSIPCFPWMAQVQFSKRYISVDKVTLLIFDIF